MAVDQSPSVDDDDPRHLPRYRTSAHISYKMMPRALQPLWELVQEGKRIEAMPMPIVMVLALAGHLSYRRAIHLTDGGS